MGEIIVVDRSDKVIGLKDRDLVHSTGELHRVAYVYTYNKRGDNLIHWRSPIKKGMYGDRILACVGDHSNKDDLIRNGNGSKNRPSLSAPYRSMAIRALEEYGWGKKGNMPVNDDHLHFLGRMLVEKSPTDKEYQGIFAFYYNGEPPQITVDKREVLRTRWGFLDEIVIAPHEETDKRDPIIPVPNVESQKKIMAMLELHLSDHTDIDNAFLRYINAA